ncbi:hypothetical protein KC799_06845 [candidate division KSB1 bacterium]|nr:hypothetical protein [candidate division KSB1 bacterium]
MRHRPHADSYLGAGWPGFGVSSAERRRLVALRLNGCPPNCLLLRHEQEMPEAVVLCPGAAILLEKEEINGYFRLRLPARGAYKGPGRGNGWLQSSKRAPG